MVATRLLPVMLSLLCSDVYAQAERLIVRKDPSDSSRYLCEIPFATFASPAGWSANQSDGMTYAILTPSGETYPKVTKMISVDVAAPAATTAKETALAFARKWKGQLSQRAIMIDGVRGYQVLIPPDAQSLRPINCLIAMHGGKTVLLIGGARQRDMGVGKALDEIVASWKWKR